MSISFIFELITGLAMFLFGMNAMGDGLKKVAGSKLETVLWKLSSTPTRGVLLGTGVTAVIQSSSATSCMVVGFVNSGMMNIAQAIGIIMGANIGTTATGWILSLSAVGGDSTATGFDWTQFLSTTFIAAVFALIGTLFMMFAKKASLQHTGSIMLGFAVLMSGMKMMSKAMGFLEGNPMFEDLMTTMSNPFFGILVGTVITAILQSASASIGILQSLAVTGAVNNDAAIYLIIGMCIGASMPVLLSAIGATTNGKRASIIYLIFNSIGAIILTPIFWGINEFVHFAFMDIPADAFSIAMINTVFNLATTIILMPFVKQFDKLVCALIRDKKTDKKTGELDRLEERFLTHPGLAIEQSRAVLCSMAEQSHKNLTEAFALMENYSEEGYAKVEADEGEIDKYEDKLGTYLVKITGKELNKAQSREVSKFLHTIGDFERISDHALTIADAAKEINEKQISFSHAAQAELKQLSAAVSEIVAISVKAFIDNDNDLAHRVEPLEETIDMLCDELKLRHINRVQNGNCTLTHGFVFSDYITNCERIADHCSNIAVALIELDMDEFEAHAYLSTLKEHKSMLFNTYYEEYKTKYKV